MRIVKDYPQEGINFYDVNSLFASGQLPAIVRDLAEYVKSDITHIVGIESRGFVLGAALAQELNLPFVMVRKEGSKYPGPHLKETYTTEYSTDTLLLQESLLDDTSKVVITDDLVATGGSINATQRLIEQSGASVQSCLTLIHLEELSKDINIPVYTPREYQDKEQGRIQFASMFMRV